MITYEVPNDARRMTAGVQGENEVREFLFDVTAWRTLTGGTGTAEMIVQRPGDVSPYAAVVTMKDQNTVSWVVTGADTEKSGVGHIELMWTNGDQIVKSRIVDMKIDPALDYDLPDSSLDPWESWMPDIINAAAAIQDFPGTVAEAVGDWLEENLEPTEPPVDDTLSIEGAAADAKAAGDAVAELNEALYSTTTGSKIADVLFGDYTHADNDEILFTSENVSVGDMVYYKITSTPTAAYIVLLDGNDTQIKTLGSSTSTVSGRTDEGTCKIPEGFSKAKFRTNGSDGVLTVNYFFSQKSLAIVSGKNTEAILDFDDLLSDTAARWYTKGYNPSTGGISTDTLQIRTLNLSEDIVLAKSNSLLISVYAYKKSDDAYVGTWDGMSYKKSDIAERWTNRINIRTLARNDGGLYYYKLCAKKADGSEIATADGSYVNLLVFTDKGLSVENKIADAKVVGAGLANITQAAIKAGLYVAPAGVYGTYGYRIFDTDTVHPGDTLYYKITSTPTAAYIWLFNSNGERIGNIGTSSSGPDARTYEGSKMVPSGFSYAEVRMTTGGVLTVDYLYTQNSIPMLVTSASGSIESFNLATAGAVESAVINPFDYPHYNKIYPQILITTDIHADWNRLLRAFGYSDTNKNIDLTLCLGDECNKPGDLSSFDWENSVLDCENPVLPLIGNHETAYLEDDAVQYYTDAQLYDYFFRDSLVAHNGEEHNDESLYWCKDIDKSFTRDGVTYTKKIRIIGLNQYELGEYNSNRSKLFYTQDQINWFINKLETADSNTYVLIALHTTPTTLNTVQESVMSPTYLVNRAVASMNQYEYQGYPNMLVDIVDGWLNSTRVVLTNAQTSRATPELGDTISVDKTFGGDPSDKHFIGWVCGHTHFDAYTTPNSATDQRILVFNCTSAREDLQNGDIGRSTSGKSQDCITLLSYDWDNDKVRLVRLGADYTYDGRQRIYAVI